MDISKKNQMIQRYYQLYDIMKESKDIKKMKIFGDAEKYVFKELLSSSPDLAEKWLSHLEAICWENYLSEREMVNIGKRIINQDKTKGYHWQYDVFVNTMKSLNKEINRSPIYNSYALFVTINLIYSDHAKSIAEDMDFTNVNNVPNEKMFSSCYRKAIEKFDDLDGGYNVRSYFKNKMYDDSPQL